MWRVKHAVMVHGQAQVAVNVHHALLAEQVYWVILPVETVSVWSLLIHLASVIGM